MSTLQTFSETLDYLYTNLPMFQRVGKEAFNRDLDKTLRLCAVLGEPQRTFNSIHVAGTNGKGSVSHMLASVFQRAGYQTGLYTSPHLKSFTERIRINGEEISEQFVVGFVNRMRAETETIRPSFFELTVAMAFSYFSEKKVDVAIIETGLGGKLDSTNVIIPVLSVITNVGTDHKDILGDTLEKIASEKAGIIKQDVPVIVSERQEEVAQVFISGATLRHAPITFASDHYAARFDDAGLMEVKDNKGISRMVGIELPLKGWYQERNVPALFEAVDVLRSRGFGITEEALRTGLEQTVSLTHLKGRWQVLGDKPLTICDTGHNLEGISQVFRQLESVPHARLFIIWGMVRDKDPGPILEVLPKDAVYFFTRASIPRAMEADMLAAQARQAGLKGTVAKSVMDALAAVRRAATAEDVIFVGGSTFIVAEVEGL